MAKDEIALKIFELVIPEIVRYTQNTKPKDGEKQAEWFADIYNIIYQSISSNPQE